MKERTTSCNEQKENAPFVVRHFSGCMLCKTGGAAASSSSSSPLSLQKRLVLEDGEQKENASAFQALAPVNSCCLRQSEREAAAAAPAAAGLAAAAALGGAAAVANAAAAPLGAAPRPPVAAPAAAAAHQNKSSSAVQESFVREDSETYTLQLLSSLDLHSYAGAAMLQHSGDARALKEASLSDHFPSSRQQQLLIEVKPGRLEAARLRREAAARIEREFSPLQQHQRLPLHAADAATAAANASIAAAGEETVKTTAAAANDGEEKEEREGEGKKCGEGERRGRRGAAEAANAPDAAKAADIERRTGRARKKNRSSNLLPSRSKGREAEATAAEVVLRRSGSEENSSGGVKEGSAVSSAAAGGEETREGAAARGRERRHTRSAAVSTAAEIGAAAGLKQKEVWAAGEPPLVAGEARREEEHGRAGLRSVDKTSSATREGDLKEEAAALGRTAAGDEEEQEDVEGERTAGVTAATKRHKDAIASAFTEQGRQAVTEEAGTLFEDDETTEEGSDANGMEATATEDLIIQQHFRVGLDDEGSSPQGVDPAEVRQKEIRMQQLRRAWRQRLESCGIFYNHQTDGYLLTRNILYPKFVDLSQQAFSAHSKEGWLRRQQQQQHRQRQQQHRNREKTDEEEEAEEEKEEDETWIRGREDKADAADRRRCRSTKKTQEREKKDMEKQKEKEEEGDTENASFSERKHRRESLPTCRMQLSGLLQARLPNLQEFYKPSVAAPKPAWRRPYDAADATGRTYGKSGGDFIGRRQPSLENREEGVAGVPLLFQRKQQEKMRQLHERHSSLQGKQHQQMVVADQQEQQVHEVGAPEQQQRLKSHQYQEMTQHQNVGAQQQQQPAAQQQQQQRKKQQQHHQQRDVLQQQQQQTNAQQLQQQRDFQPQQRQGERRRRIQNQELQLDSRHNQLWDAPTLQGRSSRSSKERWFGEATQLNHSPLKIKKTRRSEEEQLQKEEEQEAAFVQKYGVVRNMEKVYQKQVIQRGGVIVDPKQTEGQRSEALHRHLLRNTTKKQQRRRKRRKIKFAESPLDQIMKKNISSNFKLV